MTSVASSATHAAPGKSGRIYNFSAGPGVLPEEVLREVQRDAWDIMGSGVGILEHSHRGKVYDRVIAECLEDGKKVASLPDNYTMMFVQGGATGQCSMVPMNFLPEGKTADYYRTGKWAKDSIKDAKFYGKPHVCFDGEPTNFARLPESMAEVNYSENPEYVHFTSNNTIMGTEWHSEPDCPKGSFLVCDASSDIFSRPIDISRYGLLYAGAQKNIGTAGAVMVIARNDLLEREPARKLPEMQQYRVHGANESRFNTPPTFAIYLIGRVFKWILSQGGLEAMAKRNEEKAKLIYDVIDSTDFYTGHAQKHCRSLMNITFRMPTEALEDKFIEQAEASGLDSIRGHRSVGGVRASVYNAMPRAGCEAMAQFMKDFAAKNG